MASKVQSRSERQHIETVADRCGGKPCIVGHRIRVQDIVLWTELGKTPDEIADDFPQITLADVHAALAYYFDHKDEIDCQIAEGKEYVDQMKAAFGPGPLGQTG